MAYRVVKQLYPAPSSSGDHQDPTWAMREIYVEQTGSEAVWIFNNESEAITKKDELVGSDSTGRNYKVEEF